MIANTKYYQGFTPKELKSYVKDFPNRAKSVAQFEKHFVYSKKLNQWIRIAYRVPRYEQADWIVEGQRKNTLLFAEKGLYNKKG